MFVANPLMYVTADMLVLGAFCIQSDPKQVKHMLSLIEAVMEIYTSACNFAMTFM